MVQAVMSRRVAVFPWAGDSNPYQVLLYEALEQHGYEHVIADSYPRLDARRTLAKLEQEGVDIFHLHWPYWGPGWEIPGARHIRFAVSLHWAAALARSAMPVVWTMHNVTPHEAYTTDDRVIARRLGDAVDAKIVHSSTAIAEMQLAGISTEQTYVIPHGSYLGAYPSAPTQALARQRWGWDPADRIALFVGMIRSYKGVTELIDAYQLIRRPDTKLVVAGRAWEPDLEKQLRKEAEAGTLVYIPGYVDDDDLVTLLAAADAICMPYNRVTTSGSALLALSHHRPVVAPKLGSFTEIPESLGYFYDPGEPAGLAGALQNALEDRQPAGADESLGAYDRYLGTVGWESIAARTAQVFDSVIQRFGAR